MCWFAVGLHLFLRLALAICNQDRNCGKMNGESFLWWSMQVEFSVCTADSGWLLAWWEWIFCLWPHSLKCHESCSRHFASKAAVFQDSVPHCVLDVPVLFLPFIFAAGIPVNVHSWRKFVFFHKSWLLFNYLCLSPFLSETSAWTQLSVSMLQFPQQQFFLGYWDGIWTEI